MGDMVVALPCFHRIMESFPDARRILLTNIPISSKAASSQSILGQGALFDDSIAYPVGTRSPGRLWELARQIRRTKASTLIYLMPSRGFATLLRDYLFFQCCGIRRFIGAPTTPDLRNNRIDARTGFEEQECCRLARTLSALGPVNLDAAGAWDLVLSDTEITAGRAAIADFAGRPFIAFNMGGKAPEKYWGEARWLALLGRLAQSHPNWRFLIVGSTEDRPFAKTIGDRLPGRVIDVCGLLSPRECATALKHACLFVGHDSGPLHLAAAVGVRCVGLFGAFNRPMTWHPYGTSHRIIHRQEGMSAITVDEVESAVSELMTDGAPKYIIRASAPI
jgi:ADP-heptose:LPS heptosyltransferase